MPTLKVIEVEVHAAAAGDGDVLLDRGGSDEEVVEAPHPSAPDDEDGASANVVAAAPTINDLLSIAGASLSEQHKVMETITACGRRDDALRHTNQENNNTNANNKNRAEESGGAPRLPASSAVPTTSSKRPTHKSNNNKKSREGKKKKGPTSQEDILVAAPPPPDGAAVADAASHQPGAAGAEGKKKQTSLFNFFSARPGQPGATTKKAAAGMSTTKRSVGPTTVKAATGVFEAMFTPPPPGAAATTNMKKTAVGGFATSSRVATTTTQWAGAAQSSAAVVVSLSEGRKKALKAIVLGGGKSIAGAEAGCGEEMAGDPSDTDAHPREATDVPPPVDPTGPSQGERAEGTGDDLGPEPGVVSTPQTITPKQSLLPRFNQQQDCAEQQQQVGQSHSEPRRAAPTTPSGSNNADMTVATSTAASIASPTLKESPVPSTKKDGATEGDDIGTQSTSSAPGATSPTSFHGEIKTPTNVTAKDERATPSRSHAPAPAKESQSKSATSRPLRCVVPVPVVLATDVAVKETPIPIDDGGGVPKEADVARSEDGKLVAMKEKYEERAQEILRRCLELEQVEIPVPDVAAAADEKVEDDSFPDAAVPVAASMLEGSRETLGQLTDRVLEKLKPFFPSLSHETVASKLKVLATRKCYTKSSTPSSANAFDDDTPTVVYCWEVTVLEVLPKAVLTEVKKARGTLRRLSGYWLAVSKLVSILDSALKASEAQADKILAKVAFQEDKVIKCEREDEKVRLAAQAKAATKRLQEEERMRKLDEARRKKEEDEAKKLESARLKQQKQEEAARKKEDAKQEKQEKQLQQKGNEQEKLTRQKSTFRSFFSKAEPASSTRSPVQTVGTNLSPVRITSPTEKTSRSIDSSTTEDPSAPSPVVKSTTPTTEFDSAGFRSLINSKCGEIPSLRLGTSRRRRSRKVSVLVTVTVFPDEDAEFGALPFAEQQEVMVNNRFRFFSFHEDVRPPYHGTWSKSSRAVSGRRPFGLASALEYDYDSEAEWEEEEEAGEDLENDDAEDEEEDEEPGENYEKDGWLDEDELRKDTASELVMCLVAPVDGLPLIVSSCSVDLHSYVEGVDIHAARDLLGAHETIVLSDSALVLDAFPPDERDVDGAGGDGDKELSDDELRSVCRVVHHSTLGSKEKLVDELRSQLEWTTQSRAQTQRLLDSISEKKKHSSGSSYWEIKSEVLEKLKLSDLLEAELVIDSPGIDVDKAREVAGLVHLSTLKSKEKLVEEVRAKCGISKRTETQRLVEYVAEKVSEGGSVYWRVKSNVQEELGLGHLPSKPDVSTEDTEAEQAGSASPSSDAKKRKSIDTSMSSTDATKPKKRAPLHQVDSSSATLLAMFLKKGA